MFGFERVSRDVDATRYQPPRHKLDADEIADAIRVAARRGRFQVRVPEPATNSAASLDFDGIVYRGLLGSSTVDVEVSYREAVQLEPLLVEIGEPFYEPFPLPTMAPAEIVAEKLRTLAQRQKPTDLADLGELLDRHADRIDDRLVQQVVPAKFAVGLVRDGDHRQRILANIEAMRANYQTAVAAVSPDPIDYELAARLVEAKLAHYLDGV